MSSGNKNPTPNSNKEAARDERYILPSNPNNNNNDNEKKKERSSNIRKQAKEELKQQGSIVAAVPTDAKKKEWIGPPLAGQYGLGLGQESNVVASASATVWSWNDPDVVYQTTPFLKPAPGVVEEGHGLPFQKQQQQKQKQQYSGSGNNKLAALPTTTTNTTTMDPNEERQERAKRPRRHRPDTSDDDDDDDDDDGGGDAMATQPMRMIPLPGAIRMGGRDIISDDGILLEEEDEEEEWMERGDEKPSPSFLSSSSDNNNKGHNDDNNDHVTTLEARLVEDDEEVERTTAKDRQRLEQQIRNEFLQAAVTAEATLIPIPNPNKRRKIGLGVVAVIVLVGIVGIVVGVVMVGTNSNNNDKDPPAPPIATTLQPTTVPPTRTPQPSPGPTHMPSFQPSVAPSRSITNLDNRNVTEAHPLTLHGGIGTPQLLVNNLGNAAEQDFGIDCGAYYSSRQPGLWYVYDPRVSGPVHVIACGGTAQVSVYQGLAAMGGGNFACIEKVLDNGDNVGNCGAGSSFSWVAQVGEQYHVLVSPPYDSIATEFDDFTIELVDNDQCKYAAGPITPTSSGAVLSYTTVHATVDGSSSSNSEALSSTCGGASAASTGGPGVWYLVQGNGQALTASTCSEETTFDTQLSVFRDGGGDGGCGSLQCVNGNNDFCGIQSTVVWPSVVNETYYILVHGATDNDATTSSSSTGAFTLTLSTDTPRAENDFCDSATLVANGTDLTFAFSGSSADPDLTLCGEDGAVIADAGIAEFPYGIWYSLVGTGLPIAVTVSSTTTSPVTMNIYTSSSGSSSGSSCGGLSCVTNQRGLGCVGSGVFLECSNTACIPTTQGQVYYVFVSTESLEYIDEEHSLEVGSCL
jgi:hypothetical protein